MGFKAILRVKSYFFAKILVLSPFLKNVIFAIFGGLVCDGHKPNRAESSQVTSSPPQKITCQISVIFLLCRLRTETPKIAIFGLTGPNLRK